MTDLRVIVTRDVLLSQDSSFPDPQTSGGKLNFKCLASTRQCNNGNTRWFSTDSGFSYFLTILIIPHFSILFKLTSGNKLP